MKYLVTGGAGFIGTALTKKLVAGGHQVTVLDDFSRGTRKVLDAVRVVDGSVCDNLDRAFGDGVDTVIHLAYVQGTRNFYSRPRQVIDVALHGMLNLLDACERHGVRDFFLASSSEVYNNPPVVPTPETVPCMIPDTLNPRFSYGGGKLACEILLSAHSDSFRRAVIFRPHNIYGPDMGNDHVIPEFCLRMNKEHPDGVIPFPVQGTGEETRSFCYISDFTDQLTLLLDKAPEGTSVWHLGTMDERTVAEVARQVAKCYGREIKIVPGKLAAGSPVRRVPDTAKIQGLGYKPRSRFR